MRASNRKPARPNGAIPHGTVSGYVRWKCRCDACLAAKRAYYAPRYGDTERKRSRRWSRDQNDATREVATNSGKQWTGPELEIAARPDLTSREVALALGRTLAAVSTMRQKLRYDPKIQNLAGVSRDLT
jgi:hypothetical protein